MDAKTVKQIIFTAADGVAVAYPVSAPFIAIVEKIIDQLDGSGIFPHVMSPEQSTAMQAGIAAIKASAVTSAMAHDPFATLKKE